MSETHDRIAQLEKDVDMLRLQLKSVTENLTLAANWIEEHNRVHWMAQPPERENDDIHLHDKCIIITPEFKKWLQDADR